MSKEEFGRWLHQRRLALGWSLRTVEEILFENHRIRLSDTHLCQIEHGKRKLGSISPYVIRAVILAYDLDPGQTIRWFGFASGMAIAFEDERND